MAVTLNPQALALLLESEAGPVGRFLQRRAEAVVQVATVNASGPIIGIESGNLNTGIQYQIEQNADGLRARIFTDAEKNGFSYPAYWDRNGRPWLTDALRTVFP